MDDHIIVPRPRHSWVWPVIACLASVALIALGAVLDDDSQATVSADMEHAIGVAEGRRMAIEELQPTVRSAYQQGREDGLRVVVLACRRAQP